MTGFRHLADREVFAGRIWRVVVGEYETPEGERFTRDVVRSPGAVAVVPVRFDPEGSPVVVLVRQYRPALDAALLEVPAGIRDVPGEPPEETARRELEEEAGYAATDVEPLTQVQPSAGLTDSTHHLFLATGLRAVPTRHEGPEERHLSVVELPLADAVAMAVDGRITDSKTVIGLLLAERRLAEADGRPAP